MGILAGPGGSLEGPGRTWRGSWWELHNLSLGRKAPASGRVGQSRSNEAGGLGTHNERPGNILHFCFGTSEKDYLIWTLGAGTQEGFLEEVLFRLVQHQEWFCQMKGWGGVWGGGDSLHRDSRERLGVSRMLKATWMLQQREDAGVPLRQERKTVQPRVWGEVAG